MNTYDPNVGAGAGFAILALLPWVLVLGCAIWVYVDAHNIGARKGLIKGFCNMGPAGWALSTLLLWIIGFPLYLAKRDDIRRAANPHPIGFYASANSPAGGGPTPGHQAYRPAPPPVTPPAGWFIDPERPTYNRWWDGHAWTEHRIPRVP